MIFPSFSINFLLSIKNQNIFHTQINDYFCFMEEFKLENDHITLIRLLKALNWIESGGQAKMVVEEGLVIVNDKVESRKRKKLTGGDIVQFDKQKVKIT